MINYARKTALSLLIILYGSAFAADAARSPVGEWLVRDKTAHIRIMDCGGRLWGVISWANKPYMDKHSPDSAEQSQPVLGLPILLGMQPGAGDIWAGDIYNAENGKTYQGSIELASDAMLHVKGCVLGLLCGGEDWTRLEPPASEEAAGDVCQHIKEGKKG